jgi:hypothetical protein
LTGCTQDWRLCGSTLHRSPLHPPPAAEYSSSIVSLIWPTKLTRLYDCSCTTPWTSAGVPLHSASPTGTWMPSHCSASVIAGLHTNSGHCTGPRQSAPLPSYRARRAVGRAQRRYCNKRTTWLNPDRTAETFAIPACYNQAMATGCKTNQSRLLRLHTAIVHRPTWHPLVHRRKVDNMLFRVSR